MGNGENDRAGMRLLFLGREEDGVSHGLVSGPVQAEAGRDEYVYEDSLDGVLRRLESEPVDLLFLDMDRKDWRIDTDLPKVTKPITDTTVIVLASDDREDEARRALELGAHDYFLKSRIAPDSIYRAARQHRERVRIGKALREKDADFEYLTLLYQGILRSTPNGLCLLTPDWIIRWANPPLSRILSPDASQTQALAGLSFKRLFASEAEFEAYRSSAPRRIGMEGVDVRVLVLVRPNGSRFVAEVSIVLLDPNRADPGYVVTISDKSEQHEAWEELKWLSGVVEQTADSVFVTDRKATILYVNRAFETMTGYSGGEAVGKPTGSLLKSGVHDSSFYQNLWSTILSGRVYRAVFVNRKKSGELYHEEQTITPVLNEAGEISHFISTGRDISDRMRSQEALRLSEERFRAQFKGVPLPTFVWRKVEDDFALTEYNDAALEFTRGAVARLMGKRATDVYRDQPAIIEHLNQCFDTKGTVEQDIDYRFLFSNEVRRLHAYHNFIPPDSVLVHTEDITDRIKAEEDLRRSEARYRAIVEDQSELICRFLPDGTLTFVNDACCRLAGKRREDLLGISFIPFVHEEDRERVLAKIRLLGPDVPMVTGVFRSVSGTGEARWLEWSNRAVFDASGAVIEYQGVGLDITERKRAEETLVASEQRFSKAFHMIPVVAGISSVDDGRYVEVNEAFCQFSGYSREEAIGRTPLELGIWLSEEQMREFVEKNNEKGFLQNEPIDLRVRSGEIRHGLVSAQFVEFDGLPHVLVIFVDITEHRKAELALRESESRNRALLNALPDTMFLLTRDGVYLDYHASDPELLMYPPEQFMFRNQRDVLPPEMCELYEAASRRVVETNSMQVMEYTARHKGKDMHFEARMAPCGENRILRIVRNITEEKDLREQLMASERLAAVGQTAAIATHGMKNIFTALKGSVSLLARAIDSENVAAARQAHHLLDKSTTRLYMLFMEMLDYSKQRQPNLQRVELRPLLDEVGDLLRLIDHKKTTIECVVQGATLMGLLDREWIFRCLVNLGSNALDAVPFGGWIRLSAYMTEGDWRRKRESSESAGKEKDAPALFIEVEDNGCGVSEDDLPHIFKPLFTTKESRGSGLGLACVRQFVEIMGGRVDVITTVGEGTTFRLVFPVQSTRDE